MTDNSDRQFDPSGRLFLISVCLNLVLLVLVGVVGTFCSCADCRCDAACCCKECDDEEKDENAKDCCKNRAED